MAVFEKLTPEARKAIAAEYTSGAKMVPLMRKHSVAYSTLKRILEQEGVKARPIGYYVSPEDRDKILRLFDGGISVLGLKQRTGFSYGFIRKWLTDNGRTLLTVSEGRKSAFPVNDRAFDVLTPAAKYWLGFLMADGCVQDSGRISATLQVRDRAHLSALKAFLGAPSHSVNYDKRNNSYYFACTSQRLAGRLRALGIVARKSLICVAADCLADDRFFWLGEIDGDGSLGIDSSVGHPVIQLAGSNTIVRQFHDYLKSIFAWRVPSPSQKGNISVITAHGGKAVAIIRHLWDGHTLGLPRKRRLAERIIEEFGDLPLPHDKVATSEYRGLHFFRSSGAKLKRPWQVRYGRKHIGYFDTEASGAKAFNRAAISHGEMRKVNDFRIAFAVVRCVSVLSTFEPPPPPRVSRVAKGNQLQRSPQTQP